MRDCLKLGGSSVRDFEAIQDDLRNAVQTIVHGFIEHISGYLIPTRMQFILAFRTGSPNPSPGA
jgi:hypothetical protein